MYSGGTLGALWGHSGGTLETLWGHSESEQNATKGKVTEAKVKVMISSSVEQSHPEDTGIRKIPYTMFPVNIMYTIIHLRIS